MTRTSRLGLRPDWLPQGPSGGSGQSPNLRTWLIFGTCLLAATIAVAWLSRQTLQAERSERHARQQADLENRIRVALWRMDSIAVPLVAIESTRPTLAVPSKDSPVLAPRLLKGYVQRDATGRWTLRRDAFAKVVEPLAKDSELIARKEWWSALPAPNSRSLELRASSALAETSDVGRPSQAVETEQRPGKAVLPTAAADPNSSLIVWPSNYWPSNFAPPMNNTMASNSAQRAGDQNLNNANQLESQSRAQLKQQVFDVANLGQNGIAQQAEIPQRRTKNPINLSGLGPITSGSGSVDPLAPSQPEIFYPNASGDAGSRPTLPKQDQRTSGALIPLWVGEELLLARRVTPESKTGELIEACWLNWPEWNKVLRAEIADLLPGASLQPVQTTTPTGGDRELVALPVRLELSPAMLSATDESSWPAALVVAWVMLALTAVAIGWLLWQTLHLSERRAAFVSAVTHELRTPLTTFRLYTEMLTDGVVQDPDQQQNYFQTLHREANRLMHMVENVLAYARLEKGRPTNRTEELSLGELLERCWPRLLQRVSESPLQLELTLSKPVRETLLTTNALAVEQILFNLIDNACKYARDATEPRIIVESEATDTQVVIRVRDFGPGLSSTARRQLFEPFGKSSAQAAETAPGIGLGLSLARRLARDLGGDLQCDQLGQAGLAFVLTLPRAR